MRAHVPFPGEECIVGLMKICEVEGVEGGRNSSRSAEVLKKQFICLCLTLSGCSVAAVNN